MLARHFGKTCASYCIRFFKKSNAITTNQSEDNLNLFNAQEISPKIMFGLVQEMKIFTEITAVQFAARGDLEGLKLLPEQDLHNPDCFLRTYPVHVAAAEGYLKVVKFLHEKGVNMEQQEENMEMTPLMMAASNNHVDVVQYLVEEAHVNIHQTDNLDSTALDCANENGACEVENYFSKILLSTSINKCGQ